MSKGLISFDLDGVLANFTRGFTQIANKLFGTPVGDIASQQNWMFEDFPELGLDKVMCEFTNGPIWNEVRNDPTFWAKLDPTNVSIMPRINAIRNKIFITNRLGIDPLAQSVAFLERWGVSNPLVVVAEKKAPVAFEYKVVAHVDDYMKNMIELEQDGPRPLYLAFHYLPYNRMHHDDFMRANLNSVDKEITLSVDQFIQGCELRGLVEYA